MEEKLDLREIRQQKLEEIKRMGVNPYPYAFSRTHFSEQIHDHWADLLSGSCLVSLAGRLVSIRLMGRASFAHLADLRGKIQIYLKKEMVGDEIYTLFLKLDLGDVIGVKGKVFKTKTGEITIIVEHLCLLAKSLRPLPVVKEEKDGTRHHQFADQEMRYRQRHVDLLVSPGVRDTFVKRTQVITAIRNFLDEKGYLEVETPVLQPIYGGALARPFVTHHHKLDMSLYLRIADELYLKRLIVGGFDKVYEIAKDFRNEGMDRFHNPEFTMLELYAAYEDYNYMMVLLEELVPQVAENILGQQKITYQDQPINIDPPFVRMGYFDGLKEYFGESLMDAGIEELYGKARSSGIEMDEGLSRGKVLDKLFEAVVPPHLIQPTFVVDFPIETSPFARKHRDDPRLAERFELFIGGQEIGNAFSELNDPQDQRERFLQQEKLRDLGDEEAQVMDEDFLRALEYGMPPTAGLGVGIDRLVMVLTESASLRDVILFPQMRPER